MVLIRDQVFASRPFTFTQRQFLLLQAKVRSPPSQLHPLPPTSLPSSRKKLESTSSSDGLELPSPPASLRPEQKVSIAVYSDRCFLSIMVTPTGPSCSNSLLYEAMQDESAELCFIFHSAHSVLYFPLENNNYSTGNTALYTLQ